MLANEIMERLAMIQISPSDWRVLLVILRKTYGFHKKVDKIANFQIVEATGLCKAVVSRSLARLHSRNLIVRDGKNIAFQKDWELWQGLTESPTSEPKQSPKMRVVRHDGYIAIWRSAVEPEFQSMIPAQGYILEHRLIMARHLGRCLEPWEVVHHKGTRFPSGSIEDKHDNLPDNLELLPSQTEHMPSILAQKRIKQLEAELAELQTTVDDKDHFQHKQNRQQKLAVCPSTLAKSSTKVSSCAVTQKIKDTLQKKKEKKETAETFKETELFDILQRLPSFSQDRLTWKLRELLADYPDLNYALEFKKFAEWWAKRTLKSPWLALRNWLEKANKVEPDTEEQEIAQEWDKRQEEYLKENSVG